MVQNFAAIYIRDLIKLKEELSLYKNESDIWLLKGDVKNSAGTLTLHLIGNLKHFIGAQLGNTGFIREREKEFSDRNISKEKMLKEIDEVIATLNKVFPTIKESDLEKEYPIEFLGEKRTVGYILLVISTHLNYHLGQINYHRRGLTLNPSP